MKKVTSPATTRVGKKHAAFTAKALIDANPFHLTPSDTATDECGMNTDPEGIDNPPEVVVHSDFSQPTEKETTMSDSLSTEGYKEVDFFAKSVQDAKTEAVQAKIAAKAAKLEAAAAKKTAAEAAKAEKAIAAAAAKDAKAAERLAKVAVDPAVKAEREAAKAERAARIAALIASGEKRTYTGPMLSLADRVKQGLYVKGATGQLRCNDELATLLNAVPVDNVIQLAKIVLELPENPYSHLNVGQQSMNLRNRMRGALTKKTLTLDAIKACIEENDFATATDWAERDAARKAEREARAAAVKEAKEAAAKARADAALAKAQAKESVPA